MPNKKQTVKQTKVKKSNSHFEKEYDELLKKLMQKRDEDIIEESKQLFDGASFPRLGISKNSKIDL